MIGLLFNFAVYIARLSFLFTNLVEGKFGHAAFNLFFGLVAAIFLDSDIKKMKRD